MPNEGVDQALFQENERTAPASDERQYVDVGPLDCRRGGRLENVRVAYETWGVLSPARDNAILIQHALSGDSHAIGWWERMIGPGKGIDTDRYFVIGHNALGGCQGTTGPSSLIPDRGARGDEAGPGRSEIVYGSRFPRVTLEDMVDVQERLLAHLGIDELMGTAGGSMGGMMCVELARRNRVRKAFVTASCAAHSALQIGFNESARQAIMRDPKFRGGDYGDDPPRDGLAVARMIGHISYLSGHSFEMKFGRNMQADKPGMFQVESYLNYQGDKFTHRFDANSLIALSRAIDDYSCESLAGSTTEFCVVSYTSDWLYTPRQGALLHGMAIEAGLRSSYHLLDMPFGHDSFLLDGELQAPLAAEFWAR